MLEINNGIRTYGFIPSQINYVFRDGMTLAVVRITGEITQINFEDTTLMDNAINKIVKTMWRQLATIGSISGLLFLVNCCNVYSHSVNSDEITINFNYSNQLEIECSSNYEAVNHNDYLENIVLSTHLNDYVLNKNKYFANPALTRLQIQTIIDSAESGDVVIFENGTYNEMYLDLKDGVDIIMNDVEFVSNVNLNNRGIFKDLSPVNCKIFGRASFTFGPNNEGWLVYDQFEDSDVYIEFYKIISQRPGHETSDICAAFHQRNGKLRFKGYHISGTRIRTYDSDGQCKLIDIDVVNNVFSNGCTHFFPSQGISWDYLDIYIRSGYYEANGSDLPGYSFLFTAQGCNINIINCFAANNNPEYGGVIIGGDSECDYLRVWNSHFYNSTGPGEVIVLESLAEPVNFYGYNISNNSILNEYTGVIIVDEDFEIQRPDDYDEDPEILSAPFEITVDDAGYMRSVSVDGVNNASWLDIQRDNISISKSNSTEADDDKIYNVNYRYKAVSETGLQTIYSNNLNVQIMPLTDKPVKSKYTIDDTVYYNNYGAITELTINAVYVEVDNPNNDEEGRQVNTYGFSEISQLIEESKLFVSKNSLLKNLKGNYLNMEADSIQNQIRINSIDSAISGTTIKDMTGFSFKGFDFTHMDEILSPDTIMVFDGTCLFDDCSLEDATLHTNVDTLAEFKALVKSYDKNTTIWTDGDPIGER